MRIDSFDYELPSQSIAQRPAQERDSSRLMVLRGVAGCRREAASPPGSRTEPPEHRRFRDLPSILSPGDLLVVNDARVLPARVAARRSGGGRVELLFLAPAADAPHCWRVLARPAKRVRVGDCLAVGSDELRVVELGARGERVLELPQQLEGAAWLQTVGHMPLPPYIRPEATPEREAMDRRRYQTVYAHTPGAVAAPTAGLHFSAGVMRGLQAKGVDLATLTLHVGPGTFRPVTATLAEDHHMDAERYELPAATTEAIANTRLEGRRVIAVGTTVVRTLEHAARSGTLTPGSGAADLFIRPGYRFRIVDAMITNFHLPRSTPILLAAALLGRTRLLCVYREAVERGYRFYSYGDAMLMLP